MSERSFWLMKSEPHEFSIDDLIKAPNQTVEWFGVRNYQARNYMQSEMKIGDLALFWHSGITSPGVAGIVEVITIPHPDSTQFDNSHKYYDSASSVDNPRWWCVDVKFIKKVNFITIDMLRSIPSLANMQVLRKGNRLSVSRVTASEWEIIMTLI